jgi:hypothetical protein
MSINSTLTTTRPAQFWAEDIGVGEAVTVVTEEDEEA